MKVAILGDTHFGARGDSAVFHDYFERFYKKVFFPYLLKNKISTVIQLGDLFDKKKSVNFYSLSRAQEYFFASLSAHNIKMYVPVGNHDTFYKQSNELNAPDVLLREYSNISVLGDTGDIILEDGSKITLVPWICKDNIEQVTHHLSLTSSQVVMGHLELNGFSMHKGGIPNSHGTDPKMFDKFDLVLSGHYHHRSRNGNVLYTGTPYELTWADCEDQKGFHIFDTETRSIDFVPNPYCLFKKISYDDTEKTLEQVMDFDFDSYKGSYVKIIVLAKTNAFNYDSFFKKLESVALDVKATDNSFALELNDDEIEDVDDTLTILRATVSETETQVPKDKVEQLMVELFTEASHIENI